MKTFHVKVKPSSGGPDQFFSLCKYTSSLHVFSSALVNLIYIFQIEHVNVYHSDVKHYPSNQRVTKMYSA